MTNKAVTRWAAMDLLIHCCGKYYQDSMYFLCVSRIGNIYIRDNDNNILLKAFPTL